MSQDQRDNYIAICQALLGYDKEDENFKKRIKNAVEIKMQSSQWDGKSLGLKGMAGQIKPESHADSLW